MVENSVKVVAADLDMLYKQGIVHDDETYYAALIGSKGDIRPIPSLHPSHVHTATFYLAGCQGYPMEEGFAAFRASILSGRRAAYQGTKYAAFMVAEPLSTSTLE